QLGDPLELRLPEAAEGRPREEALPAAGTQHDAPFTSLTGPLDPAADLARLNLVAPRTLRNNPHFVGDTLSRPCTARMAVGGSVTAGPPSSFGMSSSRLGRASKTSASASSRGLRPRPFRCDLGCRGASPVSRHR